MSLELKIELYKELGAYERHFNNIQNIFKGLSSTWFLAGFASIGYLYTSNINSELPVSLELLGALIMLTVSTGIILFWLMDVVVYHRLLLAVLEKSKELENEEKAKIAEVTNPQNPTISPSLI